MGVLDRAEQVTTDEIIESLNGENAQLREELWHQWEYNHSEHCDRDWPHPHGVRCHWPLPEVLRGPR